MAQVRAAPDATPAEHCARWEETTGVPLSRATMSWALRRAGRPVGRSRAAALPRAGGPHHAHRVQRPAEKVNHALLLGSQQGCGKDTILKPVRKRSAPWNYADASPAQIVGRFNGFLKRSCSWSPSCATSAMSIATAFMST